MKRLKYFIPRTDPFTHRQTAVSFLNGRILTNNDIFLITFMRHTKLLITLLKTCVMLLVAFFCINAHPQDRALPFPTNLQGRPDIILGHSTNGLMPFIVSASRDDGPVLLENFVALSNFDTASWIVITNDCGAKMKAWQTNGIEVPLKNPSALAVWRLPAQTTVSNFVALYNQDKKNHRAGAEWWQYGPDGRGAATSQYEISLRSVLDVSPTNDLIVEFRPLIYQVNKSRNIELGYQRLDLIEFPPIRIKVQPNGAIESVK